MLKKIIVTGLCVLSSIVNAAPWYRQFYGHYSFGVPTGSETYYSEHFIESQKKEWVRKINRLKKPNEEDITQSNIKFHSSGSGWLYGWYGAGYRFTQGYAIELSGFNIETNKHYKSYKNWKPWTDFDDKEFLNKEDTTLDLKGGFLTGKIYSRTFRYFRATAAINRLVRIPDAVKTEQDLQRYLNQQTAHRRGWLHTFNFYVQFGIGYCEGNQSTTEYTGKDALVECSERVIPNGIAPRPAVVGGIGGQYYFGKHISLDGAWLYIAPMESRKTVDPFPIWKIGMKVYL